MSLSCAVPKWNPNYEISCQNILLAIFQYMKNIIENHDIEKNKNQKAIDNSTNEDEQNALNTELENKVFEYRAIIDAGNELHFCIFEAKSGTRNGFITYEVVNDLHIALMYRDIEEVQKIDYETPSFNIACKRANIASKTREEILKQFNCLPPN